MSEEKDKTILDGEETAALEDDELGAVAGGGTYTSDGYLRTTVNYGCEHFVCKYCGESKSYDGKNHICKSRVDADQFRISNQNKCKNCRFHTTLKCSNPLNRRG